MLIWLLVIVPMAAGLLAQRQVAATFRRYRGVTSRSGLNGAQVARAARRPRARRDPR
jgi:Zn-dependent membrane protease YugP